MKIITSFGDDALDIISAGMYYAETKDGGGAFLQGFIGAMSIG